MNTEALRFEPHLHAATRGDLARYLVPAGRVLYSLIFLFAVPRHFTRQYIEHGAAQGLPAPEILVPLSGLIALAGALSVAIGYRTRFGAWLLILFLVPVTFAMHAFWRETDPQMVAMQQANFMKNVSMIGAALLIAYFGAGPLSVDERHLRRR